MMLMYINLSNLLQHWEMTPDMHTFVNTLSYPILYAPPTPPAPTKPPSFPLLLLSILPAPMNHVKIFKG